MRQTTVKLNDGSELIIKNSNRTLLKFEELRGKSIGEMDGKSTDSIYWLYATLLGCNRLTFDLNFEDFIDLLDENPQIWTAFNNFNKGETEPEKPEAKKKVKA
jgi:hypothetical protein